MACNMVHTVVMPSKEQVVIVASSASIFDGSLSQFLSADGTLGSEISHVVAGQGSPISGIDKNMAMTQLALAALDAIQVPPGDTETTETNARAMFKMEENLDTPVSLRHTSQSRWLLRVVETMTPLTIAVYPCA